MYTPDSENSYVANGYLNIKPVSAVYISLIVQLSLSFESAAKFNDRILKNREEIS